MKDQNISSENILEFQIIGEALQDRTPIVQITKAKNKEYESEELFYLCDEGKSFMSTKNRTVMIVHYLKKINVYRTGFKTTDKMEGLPPYVLEGKEKKLLTDYLNERRR